MKYLNQIIQGDCLEVLKTLEKESVDMVITSPPYWALRDYGVDGQLGLEPTFQEYINKLCDIFDEVKRVLKKEGTCWVNIGDTYYSNYGGANEGKVNPEQVKQLKSAGKNKTKAKAKELPVSCLTQIGSRFAIEMCNRGWILRNEIVWHKPNAMPSSAKNRFTVDFEKIFFFVKNKKYYFEQQLIPIADVTLNDKRFGKGQSIPKTGKQIGKEKIEYAIKGFTCNSVLRNKRAVWKITTKGYSEAHFAVYPEALIETPIKAGCPEGGVVLDPFIGSGTTAVVAKRLKRNWLGVELNEEYIKIAEERIRQQIKPML